MNIFDEIDALQQEIDKFRPLDEENLKQLRDYYKIGLIYTSNALEGNTLTESETKVLLEEGLTIGGKPLRDHLEAKGLSEAYDFMLQLIKNDKISEDEIKKIHKIFYYRIDEENAGKYRTNKVFITGSKYPTTNPKDIDKSMKEFIEKINKSRGKLHPVQLAALAHKEFVFIHPFVDGNGRVARLLMNLILLQSGYMLAIIPPVMRSEYIRTLEKAHTDESEFVNLIARMEKETQKDYLRLLDS